MTPLIPTLFCILLLLGGCSTHYHRIEDDTLTLYLKKPGALQVFLACSSDNFVPRKARNANSSWTVSVSSRATFRYFYIVDNQTYLPPCRIREKDDFGSENCIFEPAL